MVSDTPTEGRCNAEKSTGYCEGWPTKDDDGNVINGRCWHHGGKVGDNHGAPKNNGNAEKHALRADPKKYHERQEPEEREWIFDLSETICDRIREQRGSLDPLDRVLARRIAIKLHIAAKATEYVDDTGLVQEIWVEDGGYTKEIPNAIVQELRQYDREIWNELKKLGLIDDPESQNADLATGVLTMLSEEMHGSD